jgi:hydrogenase-4 membrane subunit HyfE
MQALLLAWWLTRGRARWPQQRQLSLIAGVAASAILAFSLVLWQALRGQPILRPDALTLSAWTAWLAALVLGLILILKVKNTSLQMERRS